MTLVSHPPYLPDLNPPPVFVSPNKKGLEKAAIWHLEGHRSFDKSAEQHPTSGVPEMFRTVKQRLDKCISSNGKYLEGD
jgi:hypothetical protein